MWPGVVVVGEREEWLFGENRKETRKSNSTSVVVFVAVAVAAILIPALKWAVITDGQGEQWSKTMNYDELL